MNDTFHIKLKKTIYCKFGVIMPVHKVYRARASGVPNKVLVEYAPSINVMVDLKDVKFTA